MLARQAGEDVRTGAVRQYRAGWADQVGAGGRTPNVACARRVAGAECGARAGRGGVPYEASSVVARRRASLDTGTLGWASPNAALGARIPIGRTRVGRSEVSSAGQDEC